MKLKTEDVTADMLVSVSSYVDELIARTGNDKISKGTINYHLTEESTTLDYVLVGRQKFIVNNDKAKKFVPGKNYGTKRRMIKQTL